MHPSEIHQLSDRLASSGVNTDGLVDRLRHVVSNVPDFDKDVPDDYAMGYPVR